MVVASALTILILLIGSWNSGAKLMDFMLQLTAASNIWIYIFACIAAMVLRARPLLSALGLLFSLAIL